VGERASTPPSSPTVLASPLRSQGPKVYTPRVATTNAYRRARGEARSRTDVRCGSAASGCGEAVMCSAAVGYACRPLRRVTKSFHDARHRINPRWAEPCPSPPDARGSAHLSLRRGRGLEVRSATQALPTANTVGHDGRAFNGLESPCTATCFRPRSKGAIPLSEPPSWSPVLTAMLSRYFSGRRAFKMKISGGHARATATTSRTGTWFWNPHGSKWAEDGIERAWPFGRAAAAAEGEWRLS
jgi:hypothetical protein